MISIEESRKLLGETAESMSNDEIESLRNDLYELGSLALDGYVASKTKVDPEP